MDFVLKDKDCLAPLTICSWIEQALLYEDREGYVVPKKKIASAARHLAGILDYQFEHGCQIPD